MAGSRAPGDRGGGDGLGPRHIGLRLACSKALERFLALMGRHLVRASEANAALLGSLAALGGGFLRFPIGDPLARRLTRPRKRSAAMKRNGEWRSSMLTARSVAKL